MARMIPTSLIRSLAMALNTLGLSIEVFDRLVYMLWKDGLLFKTKTWSSGWRFLFGEGGFLRGLGADYRAWYHRDFHPNEIDDRALIEKNAPLINAEIAT